MAPLPLFVVAGTLQRPAVFAFVLDFGKVPVFAASRSLREIHVYQWLCELSAAIGDARRRPVAQIMITAISSHKRLIPAHRHAAVKFHAYTIVVTGKKMKPSTGSSSPPWNARCR